MKRRCWYSVSLITLVLVLVTGALPASAARQVAPPPGAESYDIAVSRVDNVVSREDRTAVARTGAAIIAAARRPIRAT